MIFYFAKTDSLALFLQNFTQAINAFLIKKAVG